MKGILMHKDVPVVELNVVVGAHIVDFGEVFDERHIPVGCFDDGQVKLFRLDEWWRRRTIPVNREGLLRALDEIDVDLSELLEMSYGASLMDYYWFCPDWAYVEWDDVNFFGNEFSLDFGDVLLGGGFREGMDLLSPDVTTDGMLKKRWLISNGKKFLMKGSYGAYRFEQEPVNEVVVSLLAKRLGIDCVEYFLDYFDGHPYSLCENFLGKGEEFVPARNLTWLCNDLRNYSLDSFLNCCEMVGMLDVKESVEKMLTLDFIVANEDRHFYNFGFVRDAESLEWKGFSPVFDSGSSLWFRYSSCFSDVPSKPFARTHEKQLRCVSDLEWFDISSVYGLREECISVVGRCDERFLMIVDEMIKRCHAVEGRRLRMFKDMLV